MTSDSTPDNSVPRYCDIICLLHSSEQWLPYKKHLTLKYSFLRRCPRCHSDRNSYQAMRFCSNAVAMATNPASIRHKSAGLVFLFEWSLAELALFHSQLRGANRNRGCSTRTRPRDSRELRSCNIDPQSRGQT